MMKMPFYNLWMDNMFYVYAGLFAASLAVCLYSVRRWLAPGRTAGEEPAPETCGPEEQAAAPAVDGPEEDLVVPDEPDEEPTAAPGTPEPANSAARDVEELLSLAADEAADKTLPPAKKLEPPAEAAPAAEAEKEPEAAAEQPTQAGDFVKGIYRSMAGIEARVGAIEESLAKGPGGNHFPVKFLEGLLEDLDSMEKDKVKARIEYLLSDLKAGREHGNRE